MATTATATETQAVRCTCERCIAARAMGFEEIGRGPNVPRMASVSAPDWNNLSGGGYWSGR